MKKLIIASLCSALCGCAYQGLNMNAASQVKPGMTKQEVIQILGREPTSVSQFGTKTVFVWIEVSPFAPAKHIQYMFDENGKLMSMDNHVYDQQKRMIDYMAKKGVGVK